MSAFIAVLMMTSVSVAIAVVMVYRARQLAGLSSRQLQRGRDHELHWVAIRLRSKGHRGSELQELLCAATNCTPDEADNAIIRVGANV